MPNTHRRRDSTVELSRVGGVYWVRNYFTTDLVEELKNNLLRIYPIELAAELETGLQLPTGDNSTIILTSVTNTPRKVPDTLK